MNIREMIEKLEDLAEDFGDNAEIRLAQQPSWPLEYSIGEINAVDINELTEEEEDEGEEGDEPEYVVFIGEGSQLGYLSRNGSKALGWN